MAMATSTTTTSTSRILCSTTTSKTTPAPPTTQYRPFLIPSSSTNKPRTISTSFIVSATSKKQQVSSSASTPRTGKFDSKNRKTSSSPSSVKEKQQDEEEEIAVSGSGEATVLSYGDGFVMPELPGDKPDFFEGPQFEALGFFVQYMWAFGIVFALAACGIAVATYNEGATDFKDTPVYKDAVESRQLLEEPDISNNADVFESNPTEQAPSLD